MNWIDSSLGLHAKALNTWSQRAEVLAGNIANADTPGYRARELDFDSVLAEVQAPGQLRTTQPGHIASPGDQTATVERRGTRTAADGNSVDMEIEQAAYARNAVKFQASAQFLDGSIQKLRMAWRGE